MTTPTDTLEAAEKLEAEKLERARRIVETTRQGGEYKLPPDPENLPAVNPRLPKE